MRTNTRKFRLALTSLTLLALLLSVFGAVPVWADVNVNPTMDAAAINAAIASQGAGDVVQFAAGTYNLLTAPLVVAKAGVILQGDTTTPGNVVINAPTTGSDRDCFQVKSNKAFPEK